MEISSKVEYITEKNLISKIKFNFSNIEIKIENSELEDKQFKDFLKSYYNFYESSKAYKGAVNISSVAGTLEGFPLEANVTYLTLNDEGEIVFQGYQKGIVKTINGIRVGKVKLVGFIDEKFRLNTSPGYAVYLTQKNDNIISGVYNQIQVDPMGRMYYEAAIREYKIYSGRKLPFDEVMIFKYKEANFNQIKNSKRIDSISHIAYYMPAKDPYGK